MKPPSLSTSPGRELTQWRFVALLLSCFGSLAHAQAIGGGLVGYATPIVGFLTVAAILVALCAAVWKPEYATKAVLAAVIGVVLFFLLRNMPALESAVSAG